MTTRWRIPHTLTALTPLWIAGLALLARLLPGPRTIDDAFITFRYARNLLAGNGFLYNPGEAVLGTTTPLYTLLMAALGLFTGGVDAPFPTLALLVNAAADALTCVLLWQLGKRLKAPAAGLLAAVLWAVAPYSVTFAIGGLETSVYVLLLTAAVWAYIDRRYPLAALMGALALVTRPDALILLGPLVLDRLYRAWRGERLRPLEFAALLIPTLTWGLFATLTFGSPFPHSVAAKLAAYQLGALESLIRLVQHYATPFLEQNLVGTPIAVGFGLLVYPFLALVGARRVLRIERRAWPWAIYPWLYLLTFALPNPLIFRWYLTPPLPAYYFFILCGASSLLSGAARRIFGQNNPRGGRFVLRTALALVLAALPLISLLSEWRIHPVHGPDRPAPDMAWIKLELLYRQAADTLRPGLSPASVLAAGDVGVLGFYTPARILDTVGLNSPVSTSYYPFDPAQYVINYAIPAALIVEQKPDYMVILEVYGRKSLLPDARFQAAYQLIERLDTDMYGSEGMLIYRRKP